MITDDGQSGVSGYRKGFSALELLVVISIMMVLMGISAVVLVGGSEDLVHGQKRLAGLLTNARAEARASRSEVTVILRQEDDQLQGALERAGDQDNPKLIRHWIMIEGKLEVDFTSEQYPNAVENAMRITFLPSGAIQWEDGYAGRFLTLRGRQGAITSEADLPKARIIYLCKGTGKVVML